LLAGLLAVVVGAVVAAWSGVMLLWELPISWFILPIPVSLVAASWLRAPDWLVARNEPGAWPKVVAVILIPVAAVLLSIPIARLRQVSVAPTEVESMRATLNLPNAVTSPAQINSSVVETISDAVHQFESINSAEALANGDKLIRTGEAIIYVEKPWLEKQSASEATQGRDYEPTAADLRQWQRDKVAANREVIDKAVKLSSSANCRFPAIERNYWDVWVHSVRELCELLVDAGDVETEHGELDTALEKYYAALRINGNFSRGQSANHFAAAHFSDRETQARLVDWAAAKGQTADRVRRAITELKVIYPPDPEAVQIAANADQYVPPRFEDSLTADYIALRNILLEKVLPTDISIWSSPDAFAFLLNKLPFERQRALRTLDFIAAYNFGQWNLVQRLWAEQDLIRDDSTVGDLKSRAKLQAKLAFNLRQILQTFRLNWWNDCPRQVPDWAPPPFSWLRTSLLLRLELQDQRSVGDDICQIADDKVIQEAFKLQLALVAYRLDHSRYPDTLDEVAPDYLSTVPFDRYSGASFQYEPHGVSGSFRGAVENIPFFWSVGRFNGRLEKSPWQPSESDDTASKSADGGQPESHFSIHNTEAVDFESAELVFPLPK
jgi:hypothetical protein